MIYRSNGTDYGFSDMEVSNGSFLVPVNESNLLQNNVTSNHTTPYEVPTEIVVLLSTFYGAISFVAVSGAFKKSIFQYSTSLYKLIN